MRAAAARGIGWLAGVALAAAGPIARAASAWPLLPQPVEVRPGDGAPLSIANGASIEIRGADRAPIAGIAARFAARVADTRGLPLRLAPAGEAHAAIVFELNPRADVGGDAGYRIDIDHASMHLAARTAQGLFYAGVTAWQLLTPPGWQRGAPAELAPGTIVDRPRFAWRALLLDSGRHFQRVAEIEQLIDWMALEKLNVLVWHLTEDQGWRLEIPAYPELTRVGACRKPLGIDAELSGSPDTPYCGFYTAADVREIVAYAAQRFVTVVPDLDLPGHSQAAVASYPWLGVSGERPPVWSEWGVSPWLLKPDRKTLDFVDAVLDEVMRLFPSPYIGIGGDEAAKDQWNASAEVQAQRKRLGLADMDQLQGWFTQQVADYLVKHGRQPLGWDDELVAGAKLPAAEIVMSWHGGDGQRVALEALRQGHAVVLAPQESLYFDHYQSDLPDEGPGQAPMITLQQAYATDVIPHGASAAQQRRILGVQACLWTELMPTFADDQHALFPRLAALSELAWSPPPQHDWNGFAARLAAEVARYDALGIAHAATPFDRAKQKTTQAPRADIARSRSGNELEPCRADAEPMRVAGTRSAQGERPVYKIDIGNPCWRWPQAPVDAATAVVLDIDRIAWQFGDEASHAVVRPKRSAAGEFDIHLDTCDGPLLASTPLAAAQARGELVAAIAQPAAGAHDVCVTATGDPRAGQWALAHLTFRTGGAR